MYVITIKFTMYGIGFMVYHLGLKIECFRGKLSYLVTLYGIG
jgi:hypothetical protein